MKRLRVCLVAVLWVAISGSILLGIFADEPLELHLHSPALAAHGVERIGFAADWVSVGCFTGREPNHFTEEEKGSIFRVHQSAMAPS
jgi:hypothetical protein